MNGKITDLGLRRNSLLVIDLNNFVFRTFFAFPIKKNSKDIPINILNNIFTLFERLIKKTNPTHIIFCKDINKRNFRYDIYPEYKGNRPPAPDELRTQLKILWTLLDDLGLCSWGEMRYEADDLIGVVAEKWIYDFDQIIIASTDKDLSQLINAKVKIYNPVKDIFIKEQDLKRDIGIYPDQVIDFLALTGDVADNVPGVHGIGEKIASELLQRFKTLENIYSSIDLIDSAKVKNCLIKNKENAFLSKTLVSIPTDINCEFVPKDSKNKKWEISNQFKELELQKAIKAINRINDELF